MFSKLSLFVASVLITFAAASPNYPPPPPTSSSPPSPSPSATPNLCCNSVQSFSSLGLTDQLLFVVFDLLDLTLPVGLGCSPITVVGNNCGGTTVNCGSSQESNGDLIAINCIPITL
ncbi:hypothetical protein C8R44DRAFT_732913 [Mycena epipterygia]|nr:hypothetical protein C8R44DRAFT_732913 [Mycena epipterygia]